MHMLISDTGCTFVHDNGRRETFPLNLQRGRSYHMMVATHTARTTLYINGCRIHTGLLGRLRTRLALALHQRRTRHSHG